MLGITIFAAPKPFEDAHLSTIQRNAIRSWLELGSQIEVLLIGDEPGLERAAEELRVRHLPAVKRNERGTPLISSVFSLARAAASHPILAYANSDVILLDDFVPAVEQVTERLEDFLMVGRRWDLTLTTALSFGNSWVGGLRSRLASEGRMHPPAGSDWFVFPRHRFAELPPFALGRAGWDNWMIFQARRLRIPVVDASPVVTVIHQDHDYHHLNGGRPHYGLPESHENVRLAGGPETVFTLADANWRLSNAGLIRVGRPGGSVWRWAEAETILRLGPGKPVRLIRLLLRPRMAWRRLAAAVEHQSRNIREAR